MMKKFHKFAAILLLLPTLLLVLSACTGGKTGENDPEAGGNADAPEAKAAAITLPYYENDSKNPYFASSALNRALASLICEPLYRVDASYAARGVLADSLSADGLTRTVTLKSATFSDGSAVTAADVVYSFEKAKASAWYGARLTPIASAAARGGSVVFTLSEAVPFAENLLTFPVVRRGSAEAAESYVTGSGAYVLTADGLSENPQKAGGALSVALLHIKNPENLKNALEIGNIDYLFTGFSDGEYTRIVAKNTFVTMNHLVYLGINHTSGALQSAAVRTAIYYAADKDAAATAGYRGTAVACGLPFHPAFCAAQSLTSGVTAADSTRADEILNRVGYNRYDKQGKRTNGQNTLQMTILVNNDNNFRLTAAYNLAENLNAVGFSVTVEGVAYEEYARRIAAGEFSLYLGETKLPENLSLSAFFTGELSVGMQAELPVFAEYAAFCRGERTAAQFSESFLDDMPFVPICYRAGMAAYTGTVQPDFSTAAYDIYGDITLWKAAE